MWTVYIRSGEKYYHATVSRVWLAKHDNGATVSCGLAVGTDLRQSQLDCLIRQGKAKEVSKEKWNHSGCQSSCILRGDNECRW